MLNSFCDKVCDNFISLNVIPKDKKALYVYGLNQAITMLFNIVTTLLIGLLLDMFWPCVIFLISFIPIRSYAGGYHAKTPLRCYLFSVVQIIVLLLILKSGIVTPFVSVVGLFLAGAVILFLAPVEDLNKPFSGGEKAAYQKRTRIILLVEMVFFAIAAICHGFMICGSIFISLATLSVMLILGQFKNRRIGK